MRLASLFRRRVCLTCSEQTCKAKTAAAKARRNTRTPAFSSGDGPVFALRGVACPCCDAAAAIIVIPGYRLAGRGEEERAAPSRAMRAAHVLVALLLSEAVEEAREQHSTTTLLHYCCWLAIRPRVPWHRMCLPACLPATPRRQPLLCSLGATQAAVRTTNLFLHTRRWPDRTHVPYVPSKASAAET